MIVFGAFCATFLIFCNAEEFTTTTTQIIDTTTTEILETSTALKEDIIETTTLNVSDDVNTTITTVSEDKTTTDKIDETSNSTSTITTTTTETTTLHPIAEACAPEITVIIYIRGKKYF